MEKELISGLIKMYKENSASLVNDPLYATWNFSHPTMLERIDALKTNSKK